MSQKPARKLAHFAKYRKNSKKMQKSVDRTARDVVLYLSAKGRRKE